MKASGTPRMMLILLGAAGVVVAGAAALALQSWLVLFALLALHGVATTLVVVYTLRLAARDYDKPDPLTEARIEDEEASGGDGRPRDHEVFN